MKKWQKERGLKYSTRERAKMKGVAGDCRGRERKDEEIGKEKVEGGDIREYKEGAERSGTEVFDKGKSERLIRKFEYERGVKGDIFNWMKDFLNNRKMRKILIGKYSS